jgi:hypothetical protein
MVDGKVFGDHAGNFIKNLGKLLDQKKAREAFGNLSVKSHPYAASNISLPFSQSQS